MARERATLDHAAVPVRRSSRPGCRRRRGRRAGARDIRGRAARMCRLRSCWLPSRLALSRPERPGLIVGVSTRISVRVVLEQDVGVGASRSAIHNAHPSCGPGHNSAERGSHDRRPDRNVRGIGPTVGGPLVGTMIWTPSYAPSLIGTVTVAIGRTCRAIEDLRGRRHGRRGPVLRRARADRLAGLDQPFRGITSDDHVPAGLVAHQNGRPRGQSLDDAARQQGTIRTTSAHGEWR